ncbi:MAG: hypothetical protein KAJ18_08425 [Candidatus Omnitrophica bacterium]|nr:hypothetical protein [Candidatus Omnitrophota bacterium]
MSQIIFRKIQKNSSLIAVIIITAFITITLAIATFFINFWPTDSFCPYLPTAAKLFENPFLSQMHDAPETSLNSLNMRGKETLMLGIACLQKILDDNQSLYPNTLLLILATSLSSILFFFITKNFWNPRIGLIAFILFISCLWPHLYILQGSHQPLVFLFFLSTFFFFQNIHKKKIFSFCAGVSLGFMIFSSPTAALYFPYFLLIFLLPKTEFSSTTLPLKKFLIPSLLLFFCGGLLILLLFTLPTPIVSTKKFISFLAHSQHRNHFTLYYDHLVPLFPDNFKETITQTLTFRGEGWLWITKYSLLIMPILFISYCLSIVYLFTISFKKRSSRLIFIIAISASTPLLVETAQVAQFGRNYFSWLFGIIMLIVFTIDYFQKNTYTFLSHKNKKIIKISGILLITGHLVFNLFLFFSDIFPTRMGTTRIASWLKENNIHKLLVYQNHPRNTFTVDVLNNPKNQHRVTFRGITNIAQPISGYILVPPVSGKTIWNDCASEDFQDDPYLRMLLDKDKLKNVAVASFKTIASSKIWLQEEEVCTYRDLVLDQIQLKDEHLFTTYILDAQLVQQQLKTLSH